MHHACRSEDAGAGVPIISAFSVSTDRKYSPQDNRFKERIQNVRRQNIGLQRVWE
jgi:hypothetical protein